MKENRIDILRKNRVFFNSPHGTGKLPQIKNVRDPKTGQVHSEIVGYTNLQERMNKEAKEINLLEMLKQVDEGKRQRIEGISNASGLSQSKYEQTKNVQKLIDHWDKNPLLRLCYKSKEALLKDIEAGNDILGNVKKFAEGMIKPVKETTNPSDKDIEKKVDTTKEIKKEPVKDTSDK